jgi:hypothetical protein
VDQLRTANLALERAGRPEAFAQVMRSAIALNGSFFNTQRMVLQYAYNAYFVESGAALEREPSVR